MAEPIVFTDEAAWAAATAALLAEDVHAALNRRPTALIAAAGGRTPGPILRLLAARPLDWARVVLTVTDDRQVNLDHPARNLTALGGHMAEAIAQGAQLVALDDLSGPPVPDAVLLGFGTDAHVASVFPAGTGMAAARALEGPLAVVETVPDPLPPEAPFARLTLTLSALCAAPRVIVAAKGSDKLLTWQTAAADQTGLTPLAHLLHQTKVAVTSHLLIEP